MKKILSLLLLSSSLFSMQLALKMQTPRFDRVKSAVVKQQKAIVLQTNQVISKVVDIPKMHIDASAPHNLADAKLYHGKKGFVVLHDDKKHVIEKRFMDQTARSITREGLKSFLKLGFFTLNQTNDGAFTLKAHHRLTGGGPLFGKIMYWATKVTCYTVLMAATAAIVVGGGSVGVGVVKGAKGAKLAVTTAKAAKGAYAVATASPNIKIASIMASNGAQGALGYYGGMATVTQACGAATFSTGGIAIGMTAPAMLGAGVVELGGAPTCAKIVGSGLAAGHSGTGIVAGIEFLSLSVGLACGLTPTP